MTIIDANLCLGYNTSCKRFITIERIWMTYLINSHVISKNQLEMLFPETTSQPVEIHAFGYWKSRRCEKCNKKRQGMIAKFLNNQNGKNRQQYSKQRKLCARTIQLAKHVIEKSSL